ncbi:MAG: DUF4197 domain-containing protein [Chitinophagia bacterium]|nr:DUF4197 domain-containing protein [Chitinophagia bacterium]
MAVAQVGEAQVLREYMNDASRLLGGGKKKGNDNTITNTEIVAGLKEALDNGAKSATSKLAAKDGFFGNALVKVMMPPEAKKVETTLRQLGMGAYVDKAILSMNRAAEDATQQALPIFGSAIKNMTVIDALGILKGNNDAATQYLKGKTSAQLTTAFKPIISASLDKTNATKYWTEVFEVYNSLPTTNNKVNPDLAAYVTDKAIAGVFVYIADEENRIRTNPAARATDLLKKVFGYTTKK